MEAVLLYTQGLGMTGKPEIFMQFPAFQHTPHAEQFLLANPRRDFSAADGHNELSRPRAVDASITSPQLHWIVFYSSKHSSDETRERGEY